MKKHTIDSVKKTSPKVLLKIINRAKNYLKKSDVFIDMCKSFDISTDVIDVIPVKFGDIPVSARTERGVITLNWKLLCNGDFFNNIHYLCHECEHYLQMCYGDGPTPGADTGDYLKNPAEQDAFQRQVEYIECEFGEEEAENYVDNLLDHHERVGKDRNDIKEILLEPIK